MASGQTLAVFLPEDNMPPATQYATLDVRTNTSDTPDTVMTVLDFDPGATNEFAVFRGFMPSNYGGGGLTVTLVWSSTTAVTGNVKWDVALKSVTSDADDLDTKAFAAIQTATAATASASGEVVYTDVALSSGQIDGIAAGEMFFMTVERDSSDAADTMNSDDAELHCVIIKET